MILQPRLRRDRPRGSVYFGQVPSHGGNAFEQLPPVLFGARLQASLVPENATGSPTPTFTRATAATVWGFQAADVAGASPSLLTVASGEARFMGARRISQGAWSSSLADGAPINLVNTTGATAYVDANGPFGYLAEGQRTEYLGATDTPATQTTGSLANGSYTAWLDGVGGDSLTISAGTATITGGGAAVPGTPLTFTVTAPGTVVATVAGTPTRIQLENGTFKSSYIPNAGAAGTSVTRNADVLTYPSAGNVNGMQGTAFAEVTGGGVAGVNRGIVTAAGNPLYLSGTGTSPVSLFDGTAVRSFVNTSTPFATVQKLATSWGGTASQGYLNGVAGTAQAFDGDLNTGATLGVGANTDGSSQVNGTIRNVKIFGSPLNGSQVASL